MLNLLEKFSASITLGNLKLRPSNRDWLLKKVRLSGRCIKQEVRFYLEEKQRAEEAEENKDKK